MKREFWKSWIWGGAGVVGVLVVLFGSCGVSGLRLFKALVDTRFQMSDTRYIKWCGGSLPFVQQIDKLLSGRYIVLLQNNYELRPTGGFMGSYAIVDFENGLNVHVKDIYDADGKLPGHVEPPYPIQEAFLQGWWKLRDANWAVDFPKAASDIAWFLEQGGERQVDGIIAVNMELFKKWLEVFGGLEVTTYDQKVTSKNLYVLAQRYAEENFVPGSTQKRDFLGAVGTALLEKTKGAGPFRFLKLLKLLKGELSDRQILIWFKDKELQKEAEKWEWDGGLPKLPAGFDYLYIVESNLGANKANCCITRDVRMILERDERVIKHELRLIWKNENEFSGPKPPVFWGGDYYDYARIIVKYPIFNDPVINVNGTQLRKATDKDFEMPNSLRKERSWDMYNVEEYEGFQIIGFWVKTEAKKESEAKLTWDMEITDPPGYKGLIIDRQPGIESVPMEIIYNDNKIFDSEVVKRVRIVLN